MVALLLNQENIDINARDIGNRTALHEAALNGHTAVVDLLLNHKGININITDEDDKTPLYYAQQNNHIDIVSKAFILNINIIQDGHIQYAK